jgi:methylated-DNA-[protein]-cysteine S-methyltransferase
MDYQRKLQKLLLAVPKGKVTTYREIAHAMNTRGYRFVGQLLHKNPHPDTVPCYKVVQSDGRLGGFALGQAEKIKRLKKDGISVQEGKVRDFADKLYRFKTNGEITE